VAPTVAALPEKDPGSCATAAGNRPLHLVLFGLLLRTLFLEGFLGFLLDVFLHVLGFGHFLILLWVCAIIDNPARDLSKNPENENPSIDFRGDQAIM
jgi:hypothetical protein